MKPLVPQIGHLMKPRMPLSLNFLDWSLMDLWVDLQDAQQWMGNELIELLSDYGGKITIMRLLRVNSNLKWIA